MQHVEEDTFSEPVRMLTGLPKCFEVRPITAVFPRAFCRNSKLDAASQDIAHIFLLAHRSGSADEQHSRPGIVVSS